MQTLKRRGFIKVAVQEFIGLRGFREAWGNQGAMANTIETSIQSLGFRGV